MSAERKLLIVTLLAGLYNATLVLGDLLYP